MTDEQNLFETEIFFTALADKTRLRLLNLMRGGEVCVLFFVDVLGEGQPKISRHLAYLKNAGIVEARRDGKWIYYRIAAPKSDSAARVLREALAWLASQEKMKDEYEKLLNVFHLQDDSANISHAAPHEISVNANMNDKPRRELETYLL